MAAETRLAILKTFQANGLLLDKEALSVLSEYVYSVGESENVILQLIESCQAGQPRSHGNTYLSFRDCEASYCLSQMLQSASAQIIDSARATQSIRFPLQMTV